MLATFPFAYGPASMCLFDRMTFKKGIEKSLQFPGRPRVVTMLLKVPLVHLSDPQKRVAQVSPHFQPSKESHGPYIDTTIGKCP